MIKYLKNLFTIRKRTSYSWLKRNPHIVVLDPDGWDRRPGFYEKSMKEKITKEEFRSRVSQSTTMLRRENFDENWQLKVK